MQIYIAAPLFSAAERNFNIQLAEALERVGFEVFLPQRDGGEAKNPQYSELPLEDRRSIMFELDRDQIIGADIFVYVLDGRVPDEGAAVELGIAYMAKVAGSKAKYLLGLHTDQRSTFRDASLNPMLSTPLEFVADSQEALLKQLHAIKKASD
jgi:nucleoside 2-deoxyribosyltransferase